MIVPMADPRGKSKVHMKVSYGRHEEQWSRFSSPSLSLTCVQSLHQNALDRLNMRVQPREISIQFAS